MQVLVILDNPVIKETHSLFLAQLTATGATVDIKIAEDHTIQLKELVTNISFRSYQGKCSSWSAFDIS